MSDTKFTEDYCDQPGNPFRKRTPVMSGIVTEYWPNGNNKQYNENVLINIQLL